MASTLALLPVLQNWLVLNRYSLLASLLVLLLAGLARALGQRVEVQLLGPRAVQPTGPGQRLRQLLAQSYFPIAALLAGQLVGGVGTLLGQPEVGTSVERLAGVFWFLLFYGLVAEVTRQLLPKGPSEKLIRLVLLPAAALGSIVYLLGFWGQFRAWVTAPILAGQGVRLSVGDLVLAVLILALASQLAGVLRRGLRQALERQGEIEPAVADSMATILSYLVAFAGGLMSLSALGFDLTLLTVLSGALGVGAGLALQGVISNFVSGLILLFDRSIQPGDVIQVAEMVGRVQRIGIRTTTIRTREHIQLIVPNAELMENTVTNYSHTDLAVRTSISVKVETHEDPRRVAQVLLKSAAAVGRCLKEPAPEVAFTNMSEDGLELELRVWTNDPWGMPRLQSELRFQVWQQFHAADISLASNPTAFVVADNQHVLVRSDHP
jgi:small-conductance mechanosensitive channel